MATIATMPRAVLEANEAADRAMEEANRAAAETVTPKEPARTAQPAAAPAGPASNSLDDLLEEDATTPGNAPTDLQQRISLLEQDVATERQRYATLKGKIDAEGPRSAELIEELKRQLREQKEEREASTRVPGWKAKLSEQERAEFDDADSAMGVSGRAVLGVVHDMVSSMESRIGKRIDELGGKVSTGAVVSKREETLRAVEITIPSARQLNVDPLFSKFLQAERDPVTGRFWGDIAGEAYGRHGEYDPVVLTKVFQAYLKSSGQDGSQPNRKGLARPDTARGGDSAGSVRPRDRIIKTSEIKRFYEDVRARKYQNREPERAKIEAAIDKAQAESRIEVDT